MEKTTVTYEEFLSALEIVNNNPHHLARYEAQQKAIRDRQAELAYAREQGYKEGLAERLLEIMDVETVAKVTTLPVAVVRKLDEERKKEKQS